MLEVEVDGMERFVLLVALLASPLGCNGVIGDPGSSPGDDGEGSPFRPGATADPLADPGGFGQTEIRRLSRAELAETVRTLLGVELVDELDLLPTDPSTPFDNDYTLQEASAALVEGLKAIADRVAADVATDPELRERVVGCTPAGAVDDACFRSFIESFGRRALRRPLDDYEVGRFMELSSFGETAGDFYLSVSVAIRAFLQHPELLHIVEIGDPVEGAPGLFALTDFEMASRLAFFLWGGGPDDPILDLADAGTLSTRDDVRAAAEQMLADPRAAARIERFHALWLGYDHYEGAALPTAMRTETDALVRRVVFEERRPWIELFTFGETFVDANLAEHYGYDAPAGGGPGWIPYAGDRAGILSHATVLSNGAKFGDTSPTVRGKFIRERLLCQTVPPPPPDVMVDVDEPPGAGEDACKWERYEAHRSSAGCASCHAMMDPIGFGLESYDQLGRFRTHEPDNPETSFDESTCAIRDDGELVGVGTFRGPAELGQRLSETEELSHCFVTQLYRFGIGRTENAEEQRTIDALWERFGESEQRVDQLILEFVSAEAFRHRWVGED